jgi:predicted dehydrogenase
MRKLKVIQVGICHEHANGKYRALKKLPDIFDVVGVVDERSFCHTPRYREHLFILEQERVLTLDEALHHPGLDAVLIEVPNLDLVPVAMEFARRRIPMHVDKTCGETVQPYQELLALCESENLPFQMGYVFRNNRAFRFVIEACRAGLLGDIFDIECDMNHCYGADDYQQYIGKFKGGIIFNLGSHLIDIITMILGRPERVFSSLKSVAGDPASLNNGTAILDYPGATAVVRACSREVRGIPGRAFRVAGTNGTIRFSPVERYDGQPVALQLTLKNDHGLVKAGNHEFHFDLGNDRYTSQLTEFAQIICGEIQDPYTRAHDLLAHETTLRAAGYKT